MTITSNLLIKIVFAAVAVLCVVIGVHQFPDPEWWDEFWFGGATAFALAAIILP